MKRIKKIDSDTLNKVEKYLLSGYSVHQVCANFPITFDEAVIIQQRIAEETRQEIINHKIIVRSQIRKAVPSAIQFITSVMTGKVDDLETMSGRSKVGLQLRAAQLILASAKDALNDNILTMLTEKPLSDLQPTIFDPEFKSELSADGSIRLVVNNDRPAD